MTGRSRMIALLAALLALTVVGCGDDEPDSASTTAPELIEPGGLEGDPSSSTRSTPTVRVRTVDEGDSSAGGDGGDSGVVVPEEEPVEEEPPPPPPPDNPKNDTPPPSGSSAERFEEFCNANPKECGF